MDFILRNLSLVLVKLGGAYKFCKTRIMSAYHADVMKTSEINGVAYSSCSSNSVIKFMSNTLQFYYAMSFSNP